MSLNSRQVRSIPEADAAGIEPRPGLCPICGESRPNPRFRIDGIPNVIWKCPGCGLGWMHPLPSAEEIASFYPTSYYGANGAKFRSAIEFVVRLVSARRLRFLTKSLPPGAAVLDIGCGRGILLNELSKRGFRAYGTELSPSACASVDSNIDVRVCHQLEEAGFDSGMFDQVVIWHVFEHLSDPAATLREIHRILKPGGTVVIAVPNFSSWQAKWSDSGWFHLDPPRHLFHFSLESLERILNNHGFDVRSRHHFSLRQNPFGWVQSALNRWTRQPRNGLYDWLLRNKSPDDKPESFGRKLGYATSFAFGMPIALGLEILATFFRRGATVHVVAKKK